MRLTSYDLTLEIKRYVYLIKSEAFPVLLSIFFFQVTQIFDFYLVLVSLGTFMAKPFAKVQHNKAAKTFAFMFVLTYARAHTRRY